MSLQQLGKRSLAAIWLLAHTWLKKTTAENSIACRKVEANTNASRLRKLTKL